MARKTSLLFLLLIFVCACQDPQNEAPRSLPYYGPHEYEMGADGRIDTVYYTVPKFSFIDQDSAEVSHDQTDGKPMIVEFFFTQCTSICPMITSQLSRLQAQMKREGLMQSVHILSHTVDPSTDSPQQMLRYSQSLGADLSNWHFVTGPAQDLYYQASKGYLVPAFPSDTAQGGFFHTDQLTLVDGQRHIRGYYDGTSTKEVDSLFLDLKTLLREQTK